LREAEFDLKSSQLQMEQEEREEQIARQEQQYMDRIEAIWKSRQREYELDENLTSSSGNRRA